MDIKKILNNIFFQIVVIIFSLYLIISSFIPYNEARATNEELTVEKESLTNENEELEDTIYMYREKGIEQQKIIRDQYHLSEPEEILFEFPE